MKGAAKRRGCCLLVVGLFCLLVLILSPAGASGSSMYTLLFA